MKRLFIALFFVLQMSSAYGIPCFAFTGAKDNDWARVYEAAGDALDRADFALAEVLIRRGMTATGGSEFRKILVLELLAELYEKQGKLFEAEIVLRVMVSHIERVTFPPNILAAAYLKVGELNYRLNDFDAAAGEALQAIPILVFCYGAESPQVAVALNNLAAAECSQDKLSEAQAHFRRALEIVRKNEGQKSELYGMTALNLAFVCRRLENRKEAAFWYQKAAKVLSLVRGANDPDAIEAARQFSMSTRKIH